MANLVRHDADGSLSDLDFALQGKGPFEGGVEVRSMRREYCVHALSISAKPFEIGLFCKAAIVAIGVLLLSHQ